MNPVVALLARLAHEGFHLEALGGHIAVKPKGRLTNELRNEIVRYRADVLELLRVHGPDLLMLYRDAPSWPLPVGRSSPAGPVLRLVGTSVALADGRQGLLRFVEYDTRTGRVRCRVDFSSGWALVDPEDVAIAPTGQRTA